MIAIPRFLLARAIAYGLVMIYLALDLFVFRGPLSKRIQEFAHGNTTNAISPPAAVAARIFGEDITMREVDQMVVFLALQNGNSTTSNPLEPATLFEHRTIALGQILNARAIDAKLTVNQDLIGDAGADVQLAAEEERVGGSAALDARLAAAGLSRKDFRSMLQASAARIRYLDQQLEASGANAVDQETITAWLANHQQSMTLPARIKLRHIFKATLHKDPELVHQQMLAIHKSLVDGSLDFATTAGSESDDASNNLDGGNLGWVEGPGSRLPMGLDFTTLLNAPLHTPLPPVRSALGWHIFSVEDVVKSEPATVATAGRDIGAYLRSEQRLDVLNRILDALKAEGDTRLFLETIRTTPPTVD